MEIIRTGKNCYIQECKNCCCLFAYGKEDIDEQFFRNEYSYTVICPECGKRMEASFTKRYDNN